MLQHSRNNNRQKETTDFNKVVETYVSLDYHCFRAGDKDFNATFERGLDPNAGTVNMVVSDMGQVLLNLLNNSFYAAEEKRKAQNDGFVPAIKIQTKEMTTFSKLRLSMTVTCRLNCICLSTVII